MAKQIGPIKFSGVLDDVCGRQTEDGAILQRKTGPTREQVLHHDSFKNTRRNADEFGGAVSASTLLRRVLGYTVKAVKHSKLVSYMNKKLHAVAMSDTESDWGERCVNKGDLQLLKGFEYNRSLALDVALPVALEHSLDTLTGKLQLTVPRCLVRHKRAFPKKATHFRVVSCAGAIDFDKRTFSFHVAESKLFPLRQVMETVQLNNHLVAQPGEVMVHAAGIVLFAVENGKAKILSGGAMKVLEVARVQEVMQVQPGVGKEDTCVLSQEVERQACASLCVDEWVPVAMKAAVKERVCAPCLLPEAVKGIALTVVEEVVCEVVMDEVQDVTDHAVPGEAESFSVGITDAQGIPLQEAIDRSVPLGHLRHPPTPRLWRTSGSGSPGGRHCGEMNKKRAVKKTRLKAYCKS